MILTTHAVARLSQRAIPPQVIDLLMDYGTSIRNNGADRVFLDKSGRRRAERSLPKDELAVLNRWSKVYLVVSDEGAIVTASHRRGRFRRP